VFKHTYFFTQRETGWSESWYNGTGLSMGEQITKAQAYANQRSKSLAAQSFIRYARITDLSVTPHPVWVETLGPAGTGIGGGIASASDFVDTAVLVRVFNAPQTRRKNLYVRGIPDSIIDAGGVYTPSAAFNKGIADWMEYLKNNGFGWLGVTGAAQGNITAMTQAASGQVDIQSSAALFGALAVGQHVVVRFVNVLGPLNMNGQWTCIVQSATALTTLRRVAIFPYLGSGKVRYSGTDLIQVNNGTGVRTVERKGGRPSYQSAGRQKARVVG